jgi:dual specificity phosphatase 12
MDEVIPGLWVGDLPSAKDTASLKANNIFSILSAMRGRVTINEVRGACCGLKMSLMGY